MPYPADRIDTELDPAVGSQRLSLFHTSASHAEGTNTIIEHLADVEDTLGLTPAATDVMSYIRVHDGVGKGLWLPMTALPGLNGIYLNENSNYDLWQEVEGTNQTCTTSFNARTSFGPDRLYTLPAGASVTVARSTTVPDTKSQFSALITGAASVTTVDHGVRMRSAFRMRYKTTLLVSAYVRNNTGADFTPTMRWDTPGSADSWGSPTNRRAQNLQSCVNGAWTLVYDIFDPSAFTNIDNGLSLAIRGPSGILNSGAKSVNVAQFRVMACTQLVAYVAPQVDLDKARALGYRRKSYTDGVVPGAATLVGMAGAGNGGSGATNVVLNVPFGAPMWKAPTVTIWDGAGTLNQFTKAIPNTHHSAGNVSQSGTNGFWIFNTSTSTDDMFVHYVAVSELT